MPRPPSGPDRDRSRYSARPTMTGGSPSSALAKIIRARRPGKEYTAKAAPSSKPNKVARTVAYRLTPRERVTIRARPFVARTAQRSTNKLLLKDDRVGLRRAMAW